MGKQHDLDDDGLFERAKDYVTTSIELAKLKAADKAVAGISSLIAGLVLLIVGLFFILFLNISIALFLGDLLHSYAQGFGIVTLFYLVVLVVILIIRKKHIQNPLSDLFIRKIFSKGE